MPDLNLQDEEGSLENLENLEEGEAPAEGSGEGRKGGKGAMILIVLLAVLIVGAGAVYLLNRFGIIKVFGKKAPPQVVQLQEPTPAAPQTAAGDTTATKMIETPPLQSKAKAAAPALGKPSPAATQAKQMPASTAAPKLGEMSGEYTIQVSAWRDKSIADEMVKRLTEAGYPAYVEERAYKDGSWFTVRIGRYSSRKDAQEAVQNFAEEIKSSYWIDKVRSR